MRIRGVGDQLSVVSSVASAEGSAGLHQNEPVNVR